MSDRLTSCVCSKKDYCPTNSKEAVLEILEGIKSPMRFNVYRSDPRFSFHRACAVRTDLTMFIRAMEVHGITCRLVDGTK